MSKKFLLNTIIELFSEFYKDGKEDPKTILDSPIMLGYVIKDLIAAGKLPIDLNGHFKNAKLQRLPEGEYFDKEDGQNHDYILDNIGTDFWMGLHKIMEAESKELNKLSEYHIALKHAFETGEPMKKPLEVKSRCFNCFHCAKTLAYATDGTKVWVTTPPCEFPNGYPAYDFELNVPSGYIVAGNDFREKFPVHGSYDINREIGCHKTTLSYSKVGLAHAFVGNTCPGIYRINEGKFAIGSPADGKRSLIRGARRVGGICTDLWWYSIADKQEFCRRYKIEESEIKEQRRFIDVIKCRPGVYRFHHQYHLTRDKTVIDETTSGEIYSWFEWVREPDPVINYSADYKKLNFTAGQIIAGAVKPNEIDDDLAELQGKEKPDNLHRIMSMANYLFCVNGSGMEYHENGWIGNDPDLTSDAPEIEIPIFDRAYNWYPLSGYSFIIRATGVEKGELYKNEQKVLYLNPSFVALAFNVLQSMLRYGWPEDKAYDKDGKRAAASLKLAKKAFKALAKLYPQEMPEYCKDLL